jgi:5'-phosphate synthase pdxT subunit
MVKVGVLAVQGDFLEHLEILREAGVESVYVKKVDDLYKIDALIIPGGESTTIGSLINFRNLAEPIIRLADSGVPIMGVCAGAITLAKKVVDRVVGETNQFTLGLMNISVIRNIFGRQKNSFRTRVHIENIGEIDAAFIRAPGIIDAWEPAKIIGYIDHPTTGRVGVAAVQNNLIAITFHPEITGDTKIYNFLLKMIKK